MIKLAKEFVHPDIVDREYRFRLGRTLASALAGFVAGSLGTAFYFWYVFKNLLPTYCQ